MSMLEILVAIVLLAVGLIAVAATGGLSLRGVSNSRSQLQSWAAVSRVADSLTAEGWDNVSADSVTLDGSRLRWTVAAETAELDRVDLFVERASSSGVGSVEDTLRLYLAKP